MCGKRAAILKEKRYMNHISALMQKIADIVWGPWSLGLLLGTGIFNDQNAFSANS